MSQGKFSNPRPHREEEREIEKAYRELTRKKTRKTYEHKVTAEDIARAAQPLPTETPISAEKAFPAEEDFPVEAFFPAKKLAPEVSAQDEDRQIEEAFRQVTGQPAKPRKKVVKSLDFIPEEPEFFPDERKPSSGNRKKSQWTREAAEFFQQNSRLVLSALCAVSVMIIVFVILLFARSAKDPYGEKILPNVYIGDVKVGDMSRKEAVTALDTAIGSAYSTNEMVIDLSGTQLVITSRISGATFDSTAAVEQAYAYGRTGTQTERDAAYQASRTQPYNIDIRPYLNLKTDNIRTFLNEKASNSGGTLVQTTYGLEGSEPELSAERFDRNAPTQTLVITIGKPGIGFDPDTVYNQVLDAYIQRVFHVTVEDVKILKEPDPIDLDQIYKEFYIAPINAVMDAKTGKTTPGFYGYEFDKDAAQKQLDAAKFGDEIRIPMVYVEPEIADANGFFADTLGEYQTRAVGSDERLSNIRIACEAIHGRVLNPGEVLSFRDSAGPMTASRGYKNAAEDTGTEAILSGGVSQVSSTLYCAALLSDLQIVDRENLGYLPSYIKEGFDAYVTLTIKNTLPYPIRINAQYAAGYVRISILGTEQRNYYRALTSEVTKTYQSQTEFKTFPFDNSEGIQHDDMVQKGRNGYQIKTYTLRYDRLSDQQITSDLIATSEYAPVNTIYAVVNAPENEETAEDIPYETEDPGAEETYSEDEDETFPDDG